MPYTINGSPQEIDGPVLGEGTTFVPLAGVVETLGGYVTWDNMTKTASVELGDHKARVEADNANVEADGQTITLQDAPYVDGNKIWVPVKFFQSALGCQITVDGENVTVQSA